MSRKNGTRVSDKRRGQYRTDMARSAERDHVEDISKEQFFAQIEKHGQGM